ncbi:MAG: hypothetical protein RBT64_02610 [Trichloromonas sp.]|jgi:hypothetical protein|nr:hypothetical protein [Trichloromonas sp.]
MPTPSVPLVWLLLFSLSLCACVAGPTVKSAPRQEAAAPPAWEEHQRVLQSLDALIDAYQNKNSMAFSRYVSERYTGDDMILDSRIRDTMRRVHDVGIRYTVNNLTSDGRGKVFVAVTYTREYTDIGTTQRIVHTGQAALIFIYEGGEYLLYSQPTPLF